MRKIAPCSKTDRKLPMSPTFLLLTLLALSVFGFYFGRARASALVSGKVQQLHSRPNYYGVYMALWCVIPAILIAIVWLAFQPSITQSLVISALPQELQSLPAKIGRAHV